MARIIDIPVAFGFVQQGVRVIFDILQFIYKIIINISVRIQIADYQRSRCEIGFVKTRQPGTGSHFINYKKKVIFFCFYTQI